MLIYDDILRMNAQMKSELFKHNKSKTIQQYQELKNRRAFISKKHNLAKGRGNNGKS